MNAEPEDIVRLLQRCKLDLSTEKHLQEGVGLALTQHGISFEREKRLSPLDIPDFLVAGGTAIECKMHKRARKVDVYRQLARYAAYPEVTSIVLASNMSIGLPAEINGKSIYVASMSRGWL